MLPRETRLAINQNLVGHPNIITLTTELAYGARSAESINRCRAFWAL